MIEITKRKSWIALLGILLLFAACKGETPTAPPASGTPPGGSTPPAGANLVLTASNASPIIDSTVTVTATVTQDGQPVPNGTAVEFSTTAGTFTDVTPGVTSIIRTTTNGVATVNLTASTPGLARVSAVVNNVTRFVDVTFRAQAPCVPPDPRCPVLTTPTISSVTPSVGRPQGGEIIRISGTNFIAPLRVLFDVGTGVPVPGVITNSDTTFIDVITPAVNLGAGQQLPADVIVITKVGSASEERVTANDAFTFRNISLTPVIRTLSPTSGPINGGTRVTIFGEGFQAPVQVFFGSAEAQVVSTDFGQIIVIAPDSRSTAPDGSTCSTSGCTGPVPVRVVNINSNTRGDSPEDFRYVAKMQITSISPLVGPAVGGTDVTIDGIGFDAPVQVLIGTSPEVEAQVIRVSGTQVLIRTPSLQSACTGGSGIITVTNVENGDFAKSTSPFQFIAVPPAITAVTSAAPGGSVTATVQNPGIGPLGNATIRFEVNDRTLIPTPSTITAGGGSQNFTFALPTTGFTFPTESCTTGGGAPGIRFAPLEVEVTFSNVTTGCTATTTMIVNPPNTTCTQLPPIASQTQPAPGACGSGGDVPAAAGSSVITITFRNNAVTGAQSLLVTPAGPPTGTNAADFSSATPASQTVPPQQTRSFNITFDPSGVGRREAFIVFNTNDPNNGQFTVCLEGNGTP